MESKGLSDGISEWSNAIEVWSGEICKDAAGWDVLAPACPAFVAIDVPDSLEDISRAGKGLLSLQGLISDISAFVGCRSVPNSNSIGVALQTILPPEENEHYKEQMYLLSRCADSAIIDMNSKAAVEINIASPMARDILLEALESKIISESKSRAASIDIDSLLVDARALRSFSEISSCGVPAAGRVLPVVGSTVLVGCYWHEADSGLTKENGNSNSSRTAASPGAPGAGAAPAPVPGSPSKAGMDTTKSKLGQRPLRSTYPSIFLPCRLVQIAKRHGITSHSQTGKFKNIVEDTEFTFVLKSSMLSESCFEGHIFRVFASECIICDVPTAKNSLLSVDVLSWNVLLTQYFQELNGSSPLGEALRKQIWTELEVTRTKTKTNSPSTSTNSNGREGYMDIDAMNNAAEEGKDSQADHLQRISVAVNAVQSFCECLCAVFYRSATSLNNSMLDLITSTTDGKYNKASVNSLNINNSAVTATQDADLLGNIPSLTTDLPELCAHYNSSNVLPVISHSSQSKHRSPSSRNPGLNTRNATYSLSSGCWLTPTVAHHFVRKIFRLAQDLVAIVLPFITFLSDQSPNEPQQRAMSIIESVINALVNHLPKAILLIPVPMLASSRDFAITLDLALTTRTAIYSLLSASYKIKQLSKTRPLSSSQLSKETTILRLIKECVREVDESFSSMIETFQSSVLSVIESSFMDDIARQDWASNTPFRKSQHLSYGIHGLLLTYRGIIHDLLSSCCTGSKIVRPRTDPTTSATSATGIATGSTNTVTVEESSRGGVYYRHGGMVASVCVELSTNILRVVMEMYSSLQLSRTRHSQWAADVKAVILAVSEVLLLLHSIGLLNIFGSIAQPEIEIFSFEGLITDIGKLFKSSQLDSVSHQLRVDCAEFDRNRIQQLDNKFNNSSSSNIKMNNKAPPKWAETCDEILLSNCASMLLSAITTIMIVADSNSSAVLAALEQGIASGAIYDRNNSKLIDDRIPDMGIVYRGFDMTELLNDLGIEMQTARDRDRDSRDVANSGISPRLQHSAPNSLQHMKTLTDMDISVSVSPRTGDANNASTSAIPTSSRNLEPPTIADMLSFIQLSVSPTADSSAKQSAPSIVTILTGSLSVSIGDSIALLSSIHRNNLSDNDSSVNLNSPDKLIYHDKMKLYNSISDSCRLRILANHITIDAKVEGFINFSKCISSAANNVCCDHCQTKMSLLCDGSCTSRSIDSGTALPTEYGSISQSILTEAVNRRVDTETSMSFERHIGSDKGGPNTANDPIVSSAAKTSLDNVQIITSESRKAKAKVTEESTGHPVIFPLLEAGGCKCNSLSIYNAEATSGGDILNSSIVVGFIRRHHSICHGCAGFSSQAVADLSNPVDNSGCSTGKPANISQFPLSFETMTSYIRFDASLLSTRVSLHSSTIYRLLMMRYEMCGYDKSKDDPVQEAMKAFPKLTDDQVTSLHSIINLIKILS